MRLDTSEFSGLSLSYAAHVHKAQGITAETSGILIGGWQTDKEHAYVAVSRAREQTQIYVSREDLGEQGFDTGAMQRLAEKLKRSRAQQASITKNLADRDTAHQQTTDRPRQPQRPSERARLREHDLDDLLHPLHAHPRDHSDDHDSTSRDQRDQPHHDRVQTDARERFAAHEQETKDAPVNIQDANPADIQVDVRDLGAIQLAFVLGPGRRFQYPGSPGSRIRATSPSSTTLGSTGRTSRPRACSISASTETNSLSCSRCLIVGNTSSISPAR